MNKMFTFLVIIMLILLPTRGYLEDGDLVLDRYKGIMAKVGLQPVLFPHWLHRIRFKCEVCHEDTLRIQNGADNITMAALIKGDFCGKCHNGMISWDLLYCDRCHSAKTNEKNP